MRYHEFLKALSRILKAFFKRGLSRGKSREKMPYQLLKKKKTEKKIGKKKKNRRKTGKSIKNDKIWKILPIIEIFRTRFFFSSSLPLETLRVPLQADISQINFNDY